jgi:hypothetical protein
MDSGTDIHQLKMFAFWGVASFRLVNNVSAFRSNLPSRYSMKKSTFLPENGGGRFQQKAGDHHFSTAVRTPSLTCSVLCDAEELKIYVVGYASLYFGRSLPTFRRNALTSS